MFCPDVLSLVPVDRWLARRFVAVAMGVMCCIASCASASAEVGVPAGTVQQSAADALFLQYAPAPAMPGIVCLVDSGVDLNLDTSPVVVGSYALSSSTDTGDELAALNPSLPGGHPDGHGTYMAMIAAAPANQWGMVGLAPTSVRIYNVKALAGGQTSFGFSEYAAAISRCQALSSTLPVTTVNLSLGSNTQPTGEEFETLENYVTSANAHGLGVVAASGNDGGETQAPANVPGVLGVGASDASLANRGGMCSFSNHGPGLSLLAPGCGSQTEPNGGGNGIDIAFADDGTPAWADGTSDAAMLASAAEASLRAYAPTLTYAQAQHCILSTLTNGGNLDVAAAFNACGLGRIVEAGMAAYRQANASPTPSPDVSGGQTVTSTRTVTTGKAAPRKPKIIRIVFKRHRLEVTVASIPNGLRLKIVVQARGEFGHMVALAHTTTHHRTAVLRVPGWSRIVARFLAGHTELPAVIATRRTTKRGAR
jgi:hypothetical protein